jgi:hypothetical protein
MPVSLAECYSPQWGTLLVSETLSPTWLQLQPEQLWWGGKECRAIGPFPTITFQLISTPVHTLPPHISYSHTPEHPTPQLHPCLMNTPTPQPVPYSIHTYILTTNLSHSYPYYTHHTDTYSHTQPPTLLTPSLYSPPSALTSTT